mmetsp:Transcript_23402/g.66281  ORF Transcript_23402/g.66281 Transcript_23402/m.66281 type:complete len:263 (-) Transcript_23402:1173-1961(-)
MATTAPTGMTITKRQQQQQQTDQDILEYTIDSFLSGDYGRPFAEDAAAPLPQLSPRDTVEQALGALRQLDDPAPSHGAAVFLRFCLPLTRAERWALGRSDRNMNRRRRRNTTTTTSSSSRQTEQAGAAPSYGRSKSSLSDKKKPDVPKSSNTDHVGSNVDKWRGGVLRGSLTPTIFAQRVRSSSDFSGLLRWKRLDVTEGTTPDPMFRSGYSSSGGSIAFVNAALWFEEGVEPTLLQFTLRNIAGVWLIDTARKSDKGLFMN